MVNKKCSFLARALSLYLAFGLVPAPGFAAQRVHSMSTPELQVVCPDPSNLTGKTPDYVKTLSEYLKGLGAKTVKCTSCYRSVDQQRAACIRHCGNPNGCPNVCAPPGRSQHQKQNIAVCDLGGMPANSCGALKKLCDEKFGGKCGIGGYGGGAYHFGVNDYRFSRWNRCAGLPVPPGNYPNLDPSPDSGMGATGEAKEVENNHEMLILLAVAAAGVGGAIWYKNRKK